MQDALSSDLLPALLAALLAFAAATKLARSGPWTLLVARLDARRPVRRLLAAGIPAAEIGCAALLLAWPRLGLAATAVLLAVLGTGVLLVRSRLQGERCGCLGPLARTRIGTPLAAADLTCAAACAVAAAVLPVSRPGPAALAVAVGVLAAVLVASRLPRPRRAPGPRVGARVRVPGLEGGRAGLVLFASPECPMCKPALEVLPQVAAEHPWLRTLVATAGDELWGELARRWRVPGTPYAVLVAPDGRVAWAGVGNPEALAGVAERSRSAPPAAAADAAPLSRGVALRLAASGALLATLTPSTLLGRALAATPRRRKLSDWTFKDDSRNVIHGDCERFRSAVGRGVYDASGHRQSDVIGYTYVDGMESGANCTPKGSRLPLATSVDSRRVTSTWRGRCPCPQRMKEYTDKTLCNTECPSGLACFGYQCQTIFEQVCVEVLFSIKAAKKPEITITALQWDPPDGSSSRCKVYASSYNDFVRRHEEHHAADTLQSISDFEKEYDRRYLRRCAPTEAEAQAQIDAEIARQAGTAFERLLQIDCARTGAFHRSNEGRSALPNCDMCR
jgi:hypothetical protein